MVQIDYLLVARLTRSNKYGVKKCHVIKNKWPYHMAVDYTHIPFSRWVGVCVKFIYLIRY